VHHFAWKGICFAAFVHCSYRVELIFLRFAVWPAGLSGNLCGARRVLGAALKFRGAYTGPWETGPPSGRHLATGGLPSSVWRPVSGVCILEGCRKTATELRYMELHGLPREEMHSFDSC
jgi:hypothetical protein